MLRRAGSGGCGEESTINVVFNDLSWLTLVAQSDRIRYVVQHSHLMLYRPLLHLETLSPKRGRSEGGRNKKFARTCQLNAKIITEHPSGNTKKPLYYRLIDWSYCCTIGSGQRMAQTPVSGSGKRILTTQSSVDA